MTEGLLVNDDRTLTVLLRKLGNERMLALDTEFVRERTYYPKLCLVQVACAEVTACVDCLSGIDLPALLESLTRPDRQWVVHSARQDLEVIAPHLRQWPSALIDTQIAAALCGYPPQIGLQDLLAELLNVRVSKAHTRTDWSRRPLPGPALEYALEDVEYLLPLWKSLERRLADLGRLEWFAEDSRKLLAEPPVSDAETVWRRLRGLSSLGVEQQRAALALVRWREETAQRLDRPRRWIMSDPLLVRIVRKQPQDEEALKSIGDMPPKLARRASAEILSALASAGDTALGATDVVPDDRDKALLTRLQSAAKTRAEELGLQTEVLATRRQLAELAARGAPPDAAAGWRHEELRKLLAATSAEA